MKQDLKLDEMRVVANMFTAEPGERRGVVFSRSGAMTASDGRMFIRIASPLIAETPCADARAWRAERNRLCDMINVALRSRNQEAKHD